MYGAWMGLGIFGVGERHKVYPLHEETENKMIASRFRSSGALYCELIEDS